MNWLNFLQIINEISGNLIKVSIVFKLININNILNILKDNERLIKNLFKKNNEINQLINGYRWCFNYRR